MKKLTQNKKTLAIKKQTICALSNVDINGPGPIPDTFPTTSALCFNLGT